MVRPTGLSRVTHPRPEGNPPLPPVVDTSRGARITQPNPQRSLLDGKRCYDTFETSLVG